MASDSSVTSGCYDGVEGEPNSMGVAVAAAGGGTDVEAARAALGNLAADGMASLRAGSCLVLSEMSPSHGLSLTAGDALLDRDILCSIPRTTSPTSPTHDTQSPTTQQATGATDVNTTAAPCDSPDATTMTTEGSETGRRAQELAEGRARLLKFRRKLHRKPTATYPLGDATSMAEMDPDLHDLPPAPPLPMLPEDTARDTGRITEDALQSGSDEAQSRGSSVSRNDAVATTCAVPGATGVPSGMLLLSVPQPPPPPPPPPPPFMYNPASVGANGVPPPPPPPPGGPQAMVPQGKTVIRKVHGVKAVPVNRITDSVWSGGFLAAPRHISQALSS